MEIAGVINQCSLTLPRSVYAPSWGRKPAHGTLFYLERRYVSNPGFLSVAAAAAEGRTELTVLMCEVENRLRQIGSLDDTADLDGTFALDELADQEQELW